MWAKCSSCTREGCAGGESGDVLQGNLKNYGSSRPLLDRRREGQSPCPAVAMLAPLGKPLAACWNTTGSQSGLPAR
eukprot:12237893-Alexandrium_andersonii.AAC.1